MHNLIIGILAATALNAPGTDATTCEPPCGYITPILDIKIPEKETCRNFYDKTDTCPPPPKQETLTGTIVWGWEITDQAIYQNNPQEPIIITFTTAKSNPDNYQINVQPEQFIINTPELINPQYWHNETDHNGNQIITYRYEQPITITITKTNENQQDKPELTLFLKAQSTPSGSTYRAAYGIEAFYYTQPTQDEPAEKQTIPLNITIPTLLLLLSISITKRCFIYKER